MCCRRGTFATRLLGAACRRTGAIGLAAVPGRSGGFLCLGYYDGAGRSMGADCQRRTACDTLTGAFLASARLTDDDAPGFELPFTSSIPHGTERRDV